MAMSKKVNDAKLLERLEESVTCPVCMDIFDDPRRLTCGHVFCFKCLDSIVQSHNQKHVEFSSDEDEYDEIADLANSTSSFLCPICRGEQIIPSEGLSGLEKDRTIQGFVDTIQKINTESQGAVYGNVEEEPATLRCTQHKQQVAFWCIWCQVSICNDCILGQHNGHKFSTITDKKLNDSAPPPPPIPTGGFRALQSDSSGDEYEELAGDYEEPMDPDPPPPPKLPSTGQGAMARSSPNLAAVLNAGRGGQTGLRKVPPTSGNSSNQANMRGPRPSAGLGIQSAAISQAKDRLRSRPQDVSSPRTPQPGSPSQDNISKAMGGLRQTGLRRHLTDPHLLPKGQTLPQNPHLFNQPKLRSVSDSNVHAEVDIYTNNSSEHSNTKAGTLPAQKSSPFGQGMLKPTKNRARFLSLQDTPSFEPTQEKPANTKPAVKKVPPPVKQKTWKTDPSNPNNTERMQMRDTNRQIFRRETSKKRKERNTPPSNQYENHEIRRQETPVKASNTDRGSKLPELDNILSSGRWQDLTSQLENIIQNQSPKVSKPQIQPATKNNANKNTKRPSPTDCDTPTVYENIDHLSFAFKSYRMVDDMSNYSFD